MFLKVLKYAAIILFGVVALEIAFDLINASDTILNILGYFVVVLLIALTCKFECVIKIEKDEKDNQKN